MKSSICSIILIITLMLSFSGQSQPLMENLNRGVVAMKCNDGIFISWRLLGSDNFDTAFDVYRNENGKSKKVNESPITTSTNFIDKYEGNTDSITYSVVETGKSDLSYRTNVLSNQYITIPLQMPQGYRPGDASVADLDGDGEYEIVLHVNGRGHDNAHAGMTSEPIFQAYEMDGTLLWTINLGKNIREGAHYTQFMVYDFDGDGLAEFACKTSDGSIDGEGKVIGCADSVYVEMEREDNTFGERRWGRFSRGGTAGRILKGAEYLTIFEGKTGRALSTVDYIPSRHPETNYPSAEQMTAVWGDGHGNRSERYLAGVAYLDGQNPSLIMARGYYTRTVLAAWDFKDGKLVHRWTFDSEDGTSGNKAFSGQGNHSLSIGDVDNDGFDEIIYGACVIDHDGKGLYSTGIGHADALHVSDLDPTNPGLEVFDIQERFSDAGMSMREAGSGKILWKVASIKADETGGDKGEGPGRGVSFNIDPRYEGSECWVYGAGIEGLRNAKGEIISKTTPNSCNFAIWWDGDLLREILDGNTISKWNWEENIAEPIFTADGYSSINGTKRTPVLSADLFGDWREEVILAANDGQSLRIYSTVIETPYRLYTLMHDPMYRLSIAWQNVAYNQPPHVSYYVDPKMETPKRPNIRIVEGQK